VSAIRRLDHVAIAVWDTEAAVQVLGDRLGLKVVHSERLEQPPVRLTYLDAGNCFLQLLEPLRDDSDLAAWLREGGEGMHHLCFGVDDVPTAVQALDGEPLVGPLGEGRGRPSAFLTSEIAGVRLECTGFSYAEDVEARPGWLPPLG
jgi:methylmalonyl-CoA/ethylmalonyl-CoA epimerase